MNRYHLKIINGVQLPYSVIVEADDLDHSETVSYKFFKLVPKPDGNKRYELMALYPINRTIITKIEYKIEP